MPNYIVNLVVPVLIFAILITVGFFIYKGGGYSANQPADSFKHLQGGLLNLATQSEGDQPVQPELAVEEEKNQLTHTYSNKKYGFSFHYPDGFNVSEFAEGELGDIVLMQGPSKNNIQAGFQIFIAPFDEPGPITKERILQDEPTMMVENGQSIILPSGIPAFAFLSKNQSLGHTLEVWFVHNGYLYQISTYASLIDFMTAILGTFSF